MKYILAISTLLFWSKSHTYCQNWEEIGNGMSFRVASFFTDSVEQVLYIGGHFIYADSVEARGIVKWDGENYSDLDNGQDNCGSTTCPPILAITKFQEEIYCGVWSSSIGGIPVSGIAKWDGFSWSPVGSAILDGVVYNFDLYNDELLVMGNFELMDQDTTFSLARWDGENWHPILFPEFPDGFRPRISCSAIFNGDFYFGGNFIAIINGEETRDIIRWDGLDWHPVAGGMHGSSANIEDIIVYKDELYISGQFKQSAGNAGSGIMKLQGDNWVDVGGSLDGNPDGAIVDMVILKNELYVMGLFDAIGGIEVSHIAKWNGDEWCSLGSEFNKGFLASGVYKHELYVGGAFEYIDGDTARYIAKWTGGDYVDTCGAIVSAIEPEIAEKSFELFPNPASHELRVSLSGGYENQSFNLSVFNILGERLFEKRGFDPGEAVDVSRLTPGTYILQLQTGEGVMARKFVVQR